MVLPRTALVPLLAVLAVLACSDGGEDSDAVTGRLAYSVEVDGRYEIHHFSLGEMQDEPLIRDEAADCLSPRWDSDNLIYVAQSDSGRQIMRWDSQTGESLSLSPLGFTPWATSPAPNPHRAAILYENPTSIGTEIRLWTSEGSTVPVTASANAALPQWLEDGERWAFLSSAGGQGQQLHLWEDGETRQLTDGAPIIGGYGVGPEDRLFYATGSNELLAIPLDGSVERWEMEGPLYDVAASPDSPLLALTHQDDEAITAISLFNTESDTALTRLPLPCCKAGQIAFKPRRAP